MNEWGIGKRVGYGAAQSAGLGFLAAALEIVGIAATLKLPLTFGGFVVLGLCNVAIMGAFAVLWAVVLGIPLHALRKDSRVADTLAIQLGLVVGVLCAWFLWQGAAVLVADERLPGAAAMAAMPFGFAAVGYFNARYWLRRTDRDIGVPIGWLPAAAVAALFVVLGTGSAYSARGTGGVAALEGDPNLVIISVDGLRRDAVGAYGGSGTPNIDALAARGVVYADAITPQPETSPAVASLLTGLHPLRSHVIGDRYPLARHYRTLAEVLEEEGYATGGFVSSDALHQSTGISQGFLVWDDALSVGPAGLDRLNIAGMVIEAVQGGGSRQGDDTVAALSTWLDRHELLPFFSFIHLPGPQPTEPYEAMVKRVDAQVGAIVSDLKARGIEDATMVVLAGTSGWMRGEHGVGRGRSGLWDEVIRVPLIIVRPGVEAKVTRVDKQVRLMDVLPTALEWHKLDNVEETEGVNLSAFDKDTMPSLTSSLVGRADDGWPLLGLRSNGIKVIRRSVSGTELMFDLAEDPTEKHNIFDEPHSKTTRDQAGAFLAGEQAALDRLLKEGR